MTDTLNREQAKKTLVSRQLNLLDDKSKREILSDYWHYDNESDISEDIKSGNYPEIKWELRRLIAETQSPPSVIPEGSEPLILDWLLFKLEKVLNSYISNKLNEFGIDCIVQGDIEDAGLCPCCEYYSIDPGKDGLWDICPVCFWENGGDAANHMSITDAKLNFLKMGAIDQRCLNFVDSEGALKYAKGNSYG